MAGRTVTYAYSAAGDLASATDHVGNTTRFSYDANHLLLSIQDPLGRTPLRNTYDASGVSVRRTAPLKAAAAELPRFRGHLTKGR